MDYIAPEVFSRNFGIVSQKSDFYSYGMMILEMVAGRKNTDAGIQHSSEIYFPHWIYNHLELEGNLKLLLSMLLWTFMLQAFGIHWVMPRSVAGLLSCWHQWLGKHNSNIWNLIPGCLMWIVCLERNRRSFENMEKTLDELKVLW